MRNIVLALGLLLFLVGCYVNDASSRGVDAHDVDRPIRPPWYEINLIPRPEVSDYLDEKVISYRYFFNNRQPKVKGKSERISVAIDAHEVNGSNVYIMAVRFSNENLDAEPVYLRFEIEGYDILLRYEMDGSRFIYDLDTDRPYLDMGTIDINL